MCRLLRECGSDAVVGVLSMFTIGAFLVAAGSLFAAAAKRTQSTARL